MHIEILQIQGHIFFPTIECTWRLKQQLFKCIINKVNSMYQDSDMTFKENFCLVSSLGMSNIWSVQVWEPTLQQLLSSPDFVFR